MLPLPGLSPVSGKTVVAKFDGGLLSSDGGVLLLTRCTKSCDSISTSSMGCDCTKLANLHETMRISWQICSKCENDGSRC